MALGIVRQLASSQHTQVQIPSGNYLWPTIRVLNPNDGVVYVKQNADLPDIGFGSWDYKVPSQSFGLLPGEGQGWQSVGLYYLDQSGANRPGEISIYLTQQNANDPIFQSIGRAAVTLSSSVDVASGSQPANPPAGYGRLWIDTGGHLNVLQPSGTNYLELDANNYASIVTLQGDVSGLVSNTSIHLRNTSTINAIGTDGTDRVWLRINPGGINTQFFSPQNGPFQWYTQNGGAQLLNLDMSGNLTVFGGITGNSTLSIASTANLYGGLTVVNDIRSYRSANTNTGVVYFTQASGSIYLYYDGANFQLSGGGLVVAGTLTASGNIVSNGNVQVSSGTVIANLIQYANAFTLSATAGAASALPGPPALYFTVIDQGGTQRKIPAWNV